jgi:hypothetical protein
VPNLDDERFEKYLKQFRPLAPDGLPAEIRLPPRRHSALAIWAVGATAIGIIGVASLWIVNHWITSQPNHSASVNLPTRTPALTMRDANDLLVKAPSYKAVMNELAFPPQSSTSSNDKQSALAVLSEEKIKL